MRSIITIFVICIIAGGCSKSEARKGRAPLEDDKQALLHGDLAASDRVVEYYSDHADRYSASEKAYWFDAAARNGSAFGAQSYAINLYQQLECAEAAKWFEKSTHMARSYTREYAAKMEKVNRDWIISVHEDKSCPRPQTQQPKKGPR